MAESLRCTFHPHVETMLRCGRCERPLCSRCVVQTPVGIRCRDCARLRRLPTYHVSLANYAVATAVAAILAFCLGALWALFPWRGFFIFLLAIGVGYLVGEGVSFAVNRKRGLFLQVIAGAGVVGCYLVSRLGPLAWYAAGRPGLIRMLFEIALRSLIDPWVILALILGIAVAVSRLR